MLECIRDEGVPDICIEVFKHNGPLPAKCEPWFRSNTHLIEEIEKKCLIP